MLLIRGVHKLVKLDFSVSLEIDPIKAWVWKLSTNYRLGVYMWDHYKKLFLHQRFFPDGFENAAIWDQQQRF